MKLRVNDMTGAELKRIRKGLGLSQARFATLLGFKSYHRISMLENSKETVTKTVERLARMYQINGIPPEWMPKK